MFDAVENLAGSFMYLRKHCPDVVGTLGWSAFPDTQREANHVMPRLSGFMNQQTVTVDIDIVNLALAADAYFLDLQI